ncbi:MAG TPA: serine/threonine-protein kinase [Candidatus Brocadiia bacterium]|nr:serine/threonine-protein kinase [Candidatus Brocadiia bacterium]
MAQWPFFNRTGLDHYRLGDEIARGGMSIVYQASRIADNLPVAVKLITPEFTALAEQLDAVFEKSSEGEIAASLRHPNVVRTYEFGKKGRQFYIVMELIQGPNLKRLIDAGDAAWANNRYRIALDAARGLAYIHKNKLVHRDFCPKNILLNGNGAPKIIDFGLALPAQVKDEWRFDRSGTASYMAPEQVRGQQVDFRSDIYSYGMTAYEILTGRRPYPESKSRHAKMAGHLNLEPTPLRKQDPSIPIPIEHIVMRCMAKEPAERYPTMDDVIDDMLHLYATFGLSPTS